MRSPISVPMAMIFVGALLLEAHFSGLTRAFQWAMLVGGFLIAAFCLKMAWVLFFYGDSAEWKRNRQLIKNLRPVNRKLQRGEELSAFEQQRLQELREEGLVSYGMSHSYITGRTSFRVRLSAGRLDKALGLL